MADKRVLVQEKKIYRPSGQWENLISDSLDYGFHLSNIMEVWNFRTSRALDLQQEPIEMAI